MEKQIEKLKGQHMRLKDCFEIVLSTTRSDGKYWSWQQKAVAAQKLEDFLKATGYGAALIKSERVN